MGDIGHEAAPMERGSHTVIDPSNPDPPNVANPAEPDDHGMMQKSHAHAPDPIGISLAGTRLHKPGKIMLAFRYMHMDMRQLVDGDDDISTKKVATSRNPYAGSPGPHGKPLPATWRMAPENMTMDMYMVGAMAGITKDFSVMAMVPYVEKEMNMVTFAGMSGTTVLGSSTSETSGVGDVAALGLYRLFDEGSHHAHAQMGVSFPTGSITQRTNMLMPNGSTMGMRAPYGMQIGTGTYDLLPGMTYWGESGNWNWGATAVGRIHLGDNRYDYSFGNRVYLTGYGEYGVGHGVFLSARLIQEYAGKIDGRDENINGTSPTTDPDNYGGWKTSTGLGMTYAFPKGPLQGNNLGAEFVVPVYQNLNGPQLKDNWGVWAGIRSGFSL
jgi:hypothetical protein